MTEGKERSFVAGMLKFAVDSEGKRSAVFYIMNTTKNRNRWGVTDKALEEALPTLKGKPIGLGAGYKIDKHYPDGQTIDVGKFNRTEKPGAYALGEAVGFEDERVWSDMKSRRLGATSVVIQSFQDTCSKCGADLSAMRDPFGEHPCLSVKDSSAFIQVESFRFKRVDFVDVPAYPQAGLTEMSGKAEGYTRALELLAGVYESQEHPEEGFTKLGANKNLPEENEKEKLANLEKEHSKLKSDFEAVKKAAADKDKVIEELKAQLEKAPKADEVKELKAKLEDIEKEKHGTLVAETLKARIDAGVAGKEDVEKEMLAKLDDSVLAVWKADALKVASITRKLASTPSVKYEANSESDLDKAIKERRAALGFPEIKEKQGEKT